MTRCVIRYIGCNAAENCEVQTTLSEPFVCKAC